MRFRYSVWVYDRGWQMMFGSDIWGAAAQVKRALERLGYTRSQGKRAGVYGSVSFPGGLDVGAYKRGTTRSYRWGEAPSASTAFTVGEGLQRLIGSGYAVWVRVPERNMRVSYREVLERAV